MVLYVCMYTSNVWYREEWKLLTWPANVTEHLNITNQMHIEDLLLTVLQNVAYISASVNIVKILTVSSVGIPPGTGCGLRCSSAGLMFSNFVTTLSENRFRWLNELFKRIREPIHWFPNWFDQAFEQNWLKIINHSRMSNTHCPEKSGLRVYLYCIKIQ